MEHKDFPSQDQLTPAESVQEDMDVHEADNKQADYEVKRALSDKEMLESDAAQNILPYLTLNELSEHEQAETLGLAGRVINVLKDDKLRRPDLCYEFLGYAMARIADEGELKYMDEVLSIISQDESKNISVEMFQDFSARQGDRRISSKQSQIRKLFCAALFDAANNPNDANLKWDLYKTFFGSSPNFSSYCGGLDGTLELLTISERTSQNPCSRSMIDEAAYDYSFTNDNAFKRIIDKSSPIEQLRLMPIYATIAKHCSPEDYSGAALSKIISSLDDLSEDWSCTPLVRVASESFLCDISDALDLNLWQYSPDGMDPATEDYYARRQSLEKASKQDQGQLHESFQKLPPNRPVVMIAPDVAGALNSSGQVDLICDRLGNLASLLNYDKNNAFDIDRDASFLIGIAHNPTTQALVESNLGGIDLNKISLGAQSQLVKYMAESNGERLMKLCNTMNILMYENENLAYKLAENFLAADFGEDFGDALIEIAESLQDSFSMLSEGEVEEMLDQISSCRRSIKGITELYRAFDDGEFAREYSKAINERLTDVITVFKEIARHGVAEANLDKHGEMELEYGQAIEALRYEARSLEIIDGVFHDVILGERGAFAERFLSPDMEHARSMYSLFSPKYGYILVRTRSEGFSSFNPSVDYGSEEHGVEAQISMITNPIEPFALPNPLKPDREMMRDANYYDKLTMNMVSATRIDREGYRRSEKASFDKRHSVNKAGSAVTDMAALGDRADTPSGKIARLISVGNVLRKENATAEGDFLLNHNTIGEPEFTEGKTDYGEAEEFKRLVNYMDKMILALCAIHPPKHGEGLNNKIREAKMQKRGKVALGQAA